jgi:outer membrane protein assembly factor BamB
MYKTASALMSLALCALAADTRYWSSDAQSDFEKGNLKKVALRSDGRISLSPSIKELADASLPYLWTATAGSNGNVYAAGGPSSAKSAILELTRAGQSRKLAEVDGMNVFALAVDKSGRVYAGSSPDGKIYRITPAGAVETFYDPKAKYIWALAFLPNGDLLAATGDKGELHRITPNGAGKVWMKLDEDHVRSLAIDSKGTVYVGTEPGGLIIRADAQGNPFVVYQSVKREVTTLVAAKDGSIYAAAIGQKTTGISMLIQNIQPIVVAPPPPQQGGAQVQQPRPVMTAPPPMAPNAVPGGSEIIRIDADGAPLRVWTHANDLVYALGFDASDRLLAGTGNKGNLYRIDSPSQHTLLTSLSSTQITAFVKEGGRLLAVTGNIGKIFEIGTALETQGSFESEVFDGGGFTQWGRLHSKEILSGGTVRYETRSGNLDRPTQMWSPWAPLKDGRIASPAARFLQWRAVLAGGQQDGPSLSQIDVAYLPKNVGPRIDVVEATPANYRFPAPSTTIIPIAQTLTLPPIGKAQTTVAAAPNDGSTSPALTYTRGMIGARWLASDENGDTLEFAIEIKGENEQTWKPLKDKLKDRYYSYDATAFGDGKYVVRITATDAPSNPLNQGLTAQATSAPFLIDNTAPAIRELTATPEANKLNLRFKATDALSVVAKAEISINGGDWKLIDPTVRLADSKDLEFQLALDRPTPGESTIAVRVTDEFDNQSVDKITIR